MASTSGCTHQLEELKLSDTSCTVGGSDEWNHLKAPACGADHHATTFLSFISGRSESMMEKEMRGECSVEEQIEHSKVHWSLLAGPDCNEVEQRRPRKKWQKLIICCYNKQGEEDEEVAEVSNVEEFRALPMLPIYGTFFRTFNGDVETEYDNGELVMGKKFAEGAQAEIYDVQVKWWYPEKNEEDIKKGTKYVLKVFKKGTFLKHLILQLPPGLLRFHVHSMENSNSTTPVVIPSCCCKVLHGTLLKDGRFAFLMQKEHFDLRNLIERNMKLKSGKNQGPFSKDEAEYIMYGVALGVDWLHSRDIVHRDLKASNVLIRELNSIFWKWFIFVADYECSIGVVGTGFFRAPEILQACKDRKLSQNPEVFSRAADIYSFGMTCYEILTGKLPFEEHLLRESNSLLIDLVINEHLRLELPEYVEDWICTLLKKCWQFDPTTRPTIEEILNKLTTSSTKAMLSKNGLRKLFGENFRFSYGRHAEISS